MGGVCRIMNSVLESGLEGLVADLSLPIAVLRRPQNWVLLERTEPGSPVPSAAGEAGFPRTFDLRP